MSARVPFVGKLAMRSSAFIGRASAAGTPCLCVPLVSTSLKDRIRAIDDLLLVSPDDPRMLRLRRSPYRKDKNPR